MSAIALFLAALLGGLPTGAPEAPARPAVRLGEYRLFSLYLASSRWLEASPERWRERVDSPAPPEFPVPPSLAVEPGFLAQVDPDYEAGELAVDLLLGLVWGADPDARPHLAGMEVTVLTDLSGGGFGFALSRSF